METSSIDSTFTRSRQRQRNFPRSPKSRTQRSHKASNKPNMYSTPLHHYIKLHLKNADMDNAKHFQNMIEPNDIRDLKTIITDIILCKKSLSNIINSNCDMDNTGDFESSVHNGIQNINKYVSKCGEFFYDISNGYLNTMCQTLHQLQRSDCNKMVPFNDIVRKTPVVYKLLNLLKRKLNEPNDESESSFQPTLTGEKVKNSCPNKRKDQQCNSDEEAILLTVIRDEIDGSEIYDYNTPSLQRNKCLMKCRNIASEYHFYMKRSRELALEMSKINSLNNKPIFTNTYQINPEVQPETIRLEEERMTCGGGNNLQYNHNMDTKLAQIQRLPQYQQIRRDIFNNLYNFDDPQSVETVKEYITTKLPSYIPNNMYSHQIRNEKCMYMLIEMFRFFKYMNAFIVMRALSKDLSPPFAILTPTQLGELLSKQPDSYKLNLIKYMYQVHIKPSVDKWNMTKKRIKNPTMPSLPNMPTNRSLQYDFEPGMLLNFGNNEHVHSNPSAFGFGFGGL